MHRILAVILLSISICAMPSYAAITCGKNACGPKSTSRDHACCPDAGGKSDSHHNDKSPTDSKTNCTAPCCGYVALGGAPAARPSDARPAPDLLVLAPVLHDLGSQDAIFHPPRA